MQHCYLPRTMVFTSIPAYLDPEKWQQQPTYQSVSCTDPNSQFLPPPPLPPSLSYGRGGSGSIRPGSMVDQARIANMPMPEPALKCPRCESTNTKFCYFNNYSLTQPRHFCKTCRRYWTRGGALRNVPVGGGFRRNRRIKSSSKSPATSDNQASGASGSATSPSLPPLRFTSPIRHHLTEIPGGEIGLNYSSFPTPINTAPQFPFLSAFDPFSASGYGSLHRHKQSISEFNQFNSVKIEDTGREFDLGKQLFGGSGIEQFWNVGSSPWTDISGFSSSANATNHFL